MEKSNKKILQDSLDRAFKGGISGSCAMVANVGALMWLRTTMNYQYRYGLSGKDAFKTLYKDGGVLRFYRGIGPALLQGPLSRFGDTATNAGVLKLLDSYQNTKEIPLAIQTGIASFFAGSFRFFITPIDTIKTSIQVEGSLNTLRNKLKVNGVRTLYQGSLASATSTMAGHYPWFTTYNMLNYNIPEQDTRFKQIFRNGCIGFASSIASDTTANSFKVLKVYKQTHHKSITYKQSIQNIVNDKGIYSLFFRGLKTRLLSNGIQGFMFSVLWKYFESQLT
jgi:hypothetical protein